MLNVPMDRTKSIEKLDRPFLNNQRKTTGEKSEAKVCMCVPAMPSAPAGSSTERVSLKHILMAAQISSVFTVIMPSTNALLICEIRWWK